LNSTSPFFFLFSSERSGSNLLASMIGSHSSCSFSPPTHVFRFLYLQREKYLDKKKLIKDTKSIFDVKLGSWQNEQIRITGDTIPQVLSNLFEKSTDKNVIIKELYAWKYFKEINNDFPNSKVIYLIRDPRDVYVSLLKFPNFQLNEVDFAHLWAEEQDLTLGLFDQLEIDYLLVKYEDLILNLKTELIKICVYLNIVFEQSMLDFYKSKNNKDQSNELMAWGNISQPLLRSNTKNYYKYLTYKEVIKIEENLSASLERFSYEKAKPADFLLFPLPIKTYVYSHKESEKRLKRDKVLFDIFNENVNS
jgi:hypothetical protein